MRGFVEPRCLAATFTRSHGTVRFYSARGGGGIGRGQAGRAPSEDADDSLFGVGGYGHGSPLSSNLSSGNPKLGAAPLDDTGAPIAPPGLSRGRGSTGLNQSQLSGRGFSPGPILPGLSRGRGGPSVQPAPQDPIFADRSSYAVPKFSLGLGGLGRGKPSPPSSPQAPPEEETAFLDEGRKVLPKWDEVMKRIDDSEGVSAAELRLLNDDAPVGSSFAGAAPLSPGSVGGSRGSAQQPRPSDEGRLSTGQQQVKAPLRSHYNVLGAPPSISTSKPTSPSQSPSFKKGPQQSVTHSLSQGSPNLTSPPELPVLAKGWVAAGVQIDSDSLHSGSQGSTSPKVQHISNKTSTKKPGHPDLSVSQTVSSSSYDSYDEEYEKPASSDTEVYQAGQWYYDESSGTSQAYDSSELASLQVAGQDESWDASLPTAPTADGSPDSLPEASNYDYDWAAFTSESNASKPDLEVNAEVPPHSERIRDYDARIEELYADEKLGDIDVLYAEMKASHIQPSPRTYDTLFQTYMKLGKLEKMSQVYQDMRSILTSEDGKGKAKSPKSQRISGSQEKTVSKPPESIRTDGSEEMEELVKTDADVAHEAAYAREEEISSTRDSATEHIRPAFGEKGNFGTSGEFSTETISSESIDIKSPVLSAERQGSALGVGLGRGKKIERFFDSDFSKSSVLGGLARGKVQNDQEFKPEKIDDYSETFRPVIKPELQYEFAPQGLSKGPGAGRGRLLSAQDFELGLGQIKSFTSPGLDLGAGRGRKPSSQLLGLELQPSLSRRETSVEFDYPQEQPRPMLSNKEAAERAIRILEQRKSRFARMEQWASEEEEEQEEATRSSTLMAQPRLPKERRQLRKSAKQQDTLKLLDEEEKAALKRLKAVGKNKAVEELQKSLGEFLKCFGETGCQSQHLMVFTNPDIDEKPLPPLEEFLELAKPNIMKTGLVPSEKEWQRMVKDAVKHAPYYEKFIEERAGPGILTAKEENEDLEEIASTLPLNVSPEIKSFVQRGLTTLKSNPGLNFDEKQWMMVKMVGELSEYAS